MDLSSDTSRFWRERILITVKTYPTPHRTHHEAVCTAGINAAGKWRRLWPIPFPYLEKGRQSRRYEWIDVARRKQSGDLRPESHVVDPDTIVRDGFVDARRHWGARRAMVDSWCLQGTRGRDGTRGGRWGAELAVFREGLVDLGLTYDRLTACLGGACTEAFPNHVDSGRCVPLGQGTSAAWCEV